MKVESEMRKAIAVPYIREFEVLQVTRREEIEG